MINKISKNDARKKRQSRVRVTIKGTSQKPRLCVFRSLNNIYAQIIDDEKAVTILSSSTLEKDSKSKGSNIESAKEVGQNIAKKAIEKGIKAVVFDRNGYLYHGKVKALAEAARETGLKF